MREPTNKFESGGYLIDCDVCGFTHRNYDMVKGVSGKQIGLLICPMCFDELHSRDYRDKLPEQRVIRKVE